MTLSGQDLFDVSTTQDTNKLAILNNLMTKFRIHARTAPITSFHRLVASIHGTGQLQRCYTQNFDGLQTREYPEMENKVVELHGSNRRLFCYACGQSPELPASDFDAKFINHGLVECPHCRQIGMFYSFGS